MQNTRNSGQTLRLRKRRRPTLRIGRGSRTNSNTSHQIPARVIELFWVLDRRSAQRIQPGATAAAIAVRPAAWPAEITTSLLHFASGRWLTRGASNVTEALASKTC